MEEINNKISEKIVNQEIINMASATVLSGSSDSYFDD